MRFVQRTFALGLLLLAAPVQATNYLVIIADDLGADKLADFQWDGSNANDPSTPNLEALGDAGLRFTQAWANPVCSPTRATLNTGFHAFESGVGSIVNSSVYLDGAAFDTLPELVATSADAHATGLFGKWHLGDEGSNTADDWTTSGVKAGDPPPLYHGGYDAYKGFIQGQVGDYNNWLRTLIVSGSWRNVTQTTYADQRTVLDAQTWIETQGSAGQAWLAVVGLAAPHSGAVSTGYVDDDLASDLSCSVRTSATYSCLSTSSCSDVVIYRGLVECMDERVGEFLDAVDADGNLDDTIVFFIGDNGTPDVVMEGDYASTPSGIHDYGKHSVYASGVWVPMIVADGGAWDGGSGSIITSPNRDVISPVQTMDVLATIVDDAGVALPAGAHAESLADCFTDTDSECAGDELGLSATPIYSEMFVESGGSLTSGSATMKLGRYKLVAEYDSGGACMDTELYDIGPSTGYVDPHEVTDKTGVVGYTGFCTAIRGHLNTLAPSWMPMTGASIDWCGSC